MKNKIELPIADPWIKGYENHAFLLGVLANYKDFPNFFHSHYIQISCFRNFEVTPVDFFTPFFLFDRTEQEFFDLVLLNRKTVPPHEAIPLITAYLADGYYVRFFLNDYFLPFRGYYLKEHQTHELCFWGYEADAKRFHCVGYSKAGTYTKLTLSYQDFMTAYENTDIQYPDHVNIIAIRLKKHWEYRFKPEQASLLMHDYLHSMNSANHAGFAKTPSFQPNEVHGLNVYNCFIEKLSDVQNERDAGYADIRPIHMMWEHKKAMHLHLQFYQNYFQIKDSTIIEYSSVVSLLESARMAFFKYAITQDKRKLDKVKEILQNAQYLDAELIQKVIG